MIKRSSSRLAAAAALACCGLAVPENAAAQGPMNRVIAQEQAVRRMPMDRRPNRLGHVYGNNVRRLRQRTLFVNRSRPGMDGMVVATRRYFYLR